MERGIEKMIKWVSIGLFVSFLFLVSLWAVIKFAWPIWTLLIIISVACLIGFAIHHFTKKKRTEEDAAFGSTVDTIFTTESGNDSEQERNETKEMTARWKEAMERIRNSSLSGQGNPFYVLPWYVIIGRSGCGKTHAIKGANLNPMYNDENLSDLHVSGGTQSFNLWWSNDAFLLDTAGKFASQKEGDFGRTQWHRFLSHLARYRKKEPLNGLVVAVAADELIQNSTEAIEEHGEEIRARIDEIMRTIQATFPVYVLVTKCDLIRGMKEFCDLLSEKTSPVSLNQAMGCTNQTYSDDVVLFVHNTMASIGDQLRTARLLMIHDHTTGGFNYLLKNSQQTEPDIDPKLLLFPEEFDQLKPGLTAFINALFAQDRMRVSPKLRGIFFSSGCQTGTPLSRFLQEMSLINEEEMLPDTRDGLFLKDVFTKILHSDRNLFQYQQAYVLKNTINKFVCAAICLALSILILFPLIRSYAKNRSSLIEAAAIIESCPSPEGTMNQECLLKAILKLDEKNDWWMKTGLNEGEEIEEKLKSIYCEKIKEEMIYNYDTIMAADMANFNYSTPPREVNQYVDHIVKRLRLLRLRKIGKSFEELEKERQPFNEPALLPDQYETADALNSLYLHYLVWQENDVPINQEIERLTRMLTDSEIGLDWLITWVNGDPSMMDVTLKDFWGGSRLRSEKIAADAIIPPAFTAEGKGMIAAFIGDLKVSISEEKLSKFAEEYRNFIARFSLGEQLLENKLAWQRKAEVMHTDKGPYLALIERMFTDCIEPLATEDEDDLLFSDRPLPSWIRYTMMLNLAKTWERPEPLTGADDRGIADAVGVVSPRLASRLNRIKRFRKVASRFGRGVGDRELQKISQLFQEYIDTIGAVSKQAYLKKSMFDFTKSTYDQSSSSPFFEARRVIAEIREQFEVEPVHAEMFLKGPVDFLWKYAVRETECSLQERWDSAYCYELNKNSTTEDRLESVFGSKGCVVSFLEKDAGPFLKRIAEYNFAPKAPPMQLEGSVVVFSSLFSSLSKGKTELRKIQNHEQWKKDCQERMARERESEKIDQFTVSLKAKPPGYNPGAKLTPTGTYLELQCGENTVVLEDYSNYLPPERFFWTPDSCGAVLLKIYVKDYLTLEKSFNSGWRSFPEFLKRVRTGRMRFRAEDFPLQASKLREIGLEYIDVKFELEGDYKDIISWRPKRETDCSKKINPIFPNVPKEIVSCWTD